MDGGVPWEAAGSSLFSKWFQTIRATFKGRAFYNVVAENDDAMSAVMFHTATYTIIGALFGCLYALIFIVFGAAFALPLASTGIGSAVLGGGLAAGVLAWLAVVTSASFAGFALPWVVGGVHHLMLALAGGVPPHRTYAHTVRAHAYANAGASILGLIPGIGSLLSFVFGVKNHLDAYEAVHSCGGGKAMLAFFAPVLCGCCSCGVIQAFFATASLF